MVKREAEDKVLHDQQYVANDLYMGEYDLNPACCQYLTMLAATSAADTQTC